MEEDRSAFKIGTVPDHAHSPMEGVRVWRNKRNGAFVFRLHYTADPQKTDEAWQRRTFEGMPKRDREREYEINFTTPEGDPVFSDEFAYESHVATRALPFNPKYPLLLGWDFGLSPACSFSQFLPDTRWMILHEMWVPRMGLESFAPMVWDVIQDYYPKAKIINFIDPSGQRDSEVDERSCWDVLDDVGFDDIRLGEVSWETRRRTVAMLLNRAVKGRIAVQIDPRCSMIATGFQGGYHYPKRIKGQKLTKAMTKPVKNEYSHLMDTLQYVATGMIRIISTKVDERELDAWGGLDEWDNKIISGWTR
jgi:hypothetical protein